MVSSKDVSAHAFVGNARSKHGKKPILYIAHTQKKKKKKKRGEGRGMSKKAVSFILGGLLRQKKWWISVVENKWVSGVSGVGRQLYLGKSLSVRLSGRRA
jgi:hypothetical protein